MAPTLEGGCQCGHVRYAIEGEPLGLAICHCNGCQRQSGSAFGMSLAIRRDQLTLTHGALKSFEVDCDSGNRKVGSFCPECGVRIHHDCGDGELSIKAGTLDDRSRLAPDAHYWTAAKQPWLEIPSGVEQHTDDG